MELWNKLSDGQDFMPTIEYYKAEKKYTDAVFVVFPGGGYRYCAIHEGQGYAKMFNTWGVDAFVVQYRVAPNKFPDQLNDARRAVQIIRSKAEEFGINPQKIIAVGSSAGGHLAAMLSTYKDETEMPQIDEISKESFMPNYQVLCYPVIDLVDDRITHQGSKSNLLGEDYDAELVKKLSPNLECDESAPPAFIWHNADDGCVHIYNSLEYIKNLIKHKVPVEYHIFPFGGHGNGVAYNRHSGQWGELLFNWLKEMNIYQ